MQDAFSNQLRRLRHERGLSLSELSNLVHYSRGHLSKVENGHSPAKPELVEKCDQVLRAGGALVALTPIPTRRGTPTPGHSMHADDITLAAHHEMFAAYRTLGHRTSPTVVLAGLVPQARALRAMAESNREPELTDALWLLAARYLEYGGWMAQEAGDDDAAIRLTDEAVRCAERGGDRELAAYSLVRQAEFAMYRNDSVRTVQLAKRAQAARGVSNAVRSLAAQREAQGYALAGEEVLFGRALDRAAELNRDVPSGPPAFGTTSVADPVAVARAWSTYHLGRPARAAELLAEQVPLIRADAVRSRARFGLRLALSHADAGDLDHGSTLALGLLDDVRGVDSATIRSDLTAFVRVLEKSGPLPADALLLRTRIREVLIGE
ncbi:helix-turn-helix transcriptional regulator [Saccharothrix violaceirubra]|uniref:Transcriptional regulator with XRE-family HTH domain n=1 Tax=Saccharothrix violaceirubra TaxID=413306 RepID=A0A7W7T3T9_9PSEU|nr:transcriptional regulator with XRE-family HTH domain [Saccharothrix violaceirubra]